MAIGPPCVHLFILSNYYAYDPGFFRPATGVVLCGYLLTYLHENLYLPAG